MNKNTKKELSIKRFFAFLLCGIFLAGCSGRTEGPAPGETSPTSVLGEASPTSAPGPTAPTSLPPEETASGLIIDRSQLFEVDLRSREESEEGFYPVGVQFYQGEPALFFVKMYTPQHLSLIDGKYQVTNEVELYPDSGLYIQKIGGDRELLVSGGQLAESIMTEEEREQKSSAFSHANWYVDEEGNCYYTTYHRSFYIDIIGKEYFLKLDPSGNLLYKTTLAPGFEAEGFGSVDGTMYVILGGKLDGTEVKRVVAFEAETGELSGTDAFVLKKSQDGLGSNCFFEGSNCFGWGKDGLYLYAGSKGIHKVDLSDGSTTLFMSFDGSAWTSLLRNRWQMKSFRVLDERNVEALYYREETEDRDISRNKEGIIERLSFLEGERKTVTLRAASIPSWVKLRAVEFNKTDRDYWVVLEELASGKAADKADYVRQTSVELSSGKGPDILCGDLIGDDIQGLLAKGMLLELGEPMKAAGISEGSFLPAAFGSWREGDKIYGINPYLNPRGYMIRKDALPAGTGAVDIRSLMAALSARKEAAVYFAYETAVGNLKLFLEGTEDIWGMIDWEHGTCDFSGELFEQILEVSRRYAYDAKYRCQHLVRHMSYDSIYRYDSLAERDVDGMMVSGVLFDDGCHGAVDDRNTLAVNAASRQKEGAMKFLWYLLDEKTQAELTQAVPVNRAALQEWIGNELEKAAGDKEVSFGVLYIDEGENVRFTKSYTEADMTQERVAEYLAALEDVRVKPYRTEPVLKIIYEEAADYFNGSKSIRDVSAVIRNRVQLYLDENK